MSISNWIESIIGHASPVVITDIFLVSMLIIFMISFVFAHKRTNQSFVDYTPNLLTTLGILGTFIGIVIGLQSFDPQNIESSIQNLLAGLKTAFFTSVAGMLLAVIFKGINISWLSQRIKPASNPERVTPEHIHAIMTEQSNTMIAIHRALAGDSEGTLMAQFKLLRTDLVDQHRQDMAERAEMARKLFLQMENFADLLAKSATEIVIEALRQVIVDFNKNLTEQFGENFKALDASVKKLVDWQENYRVHIEGLERRIDHALTAVESSEKALAKVSSECESINRTMTALETIIKINQHQLNMITTTLKALEALREKAIDAVPQLQKSIDEMVGSLKQGLSDVLFAMQSTVEDFSSNAKAISASLVQMTNTIESKNKDIVDTAARAIINVDKAAAETGEILRQTIAGIESGIRKSTEAAMDQMRKNLSEVLAQQTLGLNQIYSAMKSSADEFASNTKSVSQGIGQMASTIENKNNEIAGTTTRVIGTLERVSTQTSEFLEITIKKIETGIQASADAAMARMREHIDYTGSQIATQLRTSGEKTLGTIEAQVRDAANKTQENLRDQLTMFESGLRKELEAVLRDLSSGLATISRRLADDHERLSRAVSRSAND